MEPTVSYADCLCYVRRTLESSGRDRSESFGFRSRYQHSCRVMKWAQRIAEGVDGVDLPVLYTAAIFHDVGYAMGTPMDHEKESVKLFLEFAAEQSMDPSFAARVAGCIGIHSDKEKMKQQGVLTIEQLLLMEADLLDEEGALAVCWDSFGCGWNRADSYREALNKTEITCTRRRGKNPMQTARARAYWDKKQAFAEQYLRELAFDLEEPEEALCEMV